MLSTNLFSTHWRGVRLGALILTLLFGAMCALHADTPDGTGSGTFGQYLADHEADLIPFFDQHGAELAREGLHDFMLYAGEMLLIIVAAGWVVDVGLGWAFSALVAPAFATIKQAVFYATGRLALGLSLGAILGLILVLCLNFLGASLATGVVFATASILALIPQMLWVSRTYRCGAANAVAFYLILLAIHGLLNVLVVPIFFAGDVKWAIARCVDETLAPALHNEAEAIRHTADSASGPRFAARAQVAQLEARIAQAKSDEQNLQSTIEERKNSAGFAFSKLVKLRAQGHLAEARAQFTEFLQRFPNDPLAAAAKGQIGEIDTDLAAQSEVKRQQQADATRAAAQARARLLARAVAGQATLSEVREALIGKTPSQVSSLFGAPTETASNRWGYGQHMIFDPLDQTHLGLTVVFSDGVVQGVDYYYGSAP